MFLNSWLVLPADKTIKLWKVSERDKRAEGYNLRDESGQIRDPTSLTTLRVNLMIIVCIVVSLFLLYILIMERGKITRFTVFDRKVIHSCLYFQVPVLKPMELMVEASPRRIFANAHTYHINSISINSDQETYLSADDLRINLWHMEVTDQVCFSIIFIHIQKTLIQSSKIRDNFNKIKFQKYIHSIL